MARTKKPTIEPTIADATSLHHAKLALEAFRGVKSRVLKRVAGELTTKRDAIKSALGAYEKLCAAFLRAAPETTYATWCELVKPELDELVAAANDDALWDRLVETYERRAHAG